MTFMLSLLAQTAVVEPVQAAALEAQTAVPPLNLWSLSLKGGFIMIPIVLLSLVTIYIFVERNRYTYSATPPGKTTPSCSASRITFTPATSTRP